jgi:pimeloyl-ACP methyl ester carboxylesterase
MEDGIGLMAEDQAFVAERLALLVPRLGRAMEGMPIGVVGHSMGGMAATLACSRFRVFAACASLDGLVWAREGVSPIGQPATSVAKPFLLLTTPQFLPPDLSVAVARYRRAWDAPQLCLVAGGRHNSASDLPRLRGDGGSSPEAQRVAVAIRQTVIEFFRTELAGDPRRLALPIRCFASCRAPRPAPALSPPSGLPARSIAFLPCFLHGVGGEREPHAMSPNLPLVLLPDTLAICRLEADAPVPDGSTTQVASSPSVGRPRNSPSPRCTSGAARGRACERDYRAFRVRGRCRST